MDTDRTEPLNHEEALGNLEELTQSPDAPENCPNCDSVGFDSRMIKPPGIPDDVFVRYECKQCEEPVSDRREILPDSWFVDAPSWRDIFPYDSPYPHQESAIEDSLSVAKDGGYAVIEGDCGTGKTLISLATACRLIRNPKTNYRRVLILTSVKAQLPQFEEDLRLINQNLPFGVKPFTAVSLVGKSDLCPYALDNKGGLTQQNISYRCSPLRRQTSALIEEGYSPLDLTQPLEERYDNMWEPSDTGVTSPYPPQLPKTDEGNYCPFYAHSAGTDFRHQNASDHIVTPQDAVALGVENGVCPHSNVSKLANDSEVIFGNYYHAFDYDTLKMTRELLGSDTFLICDEAHTLTPSVRGILSEEATLSALTNAIEEVARAVKTLFEAKIKSKHRNVREVSSTLRMSLDDEDIMPGYVLSIYDALMEVERVIETFAADRAKNEISKVGGNPDRLPQTIEIPLRPPSEPVEDRLTEWMVDDYPESFWSNLPTLAEALEVPLNTADGRSKDRAISRVASVLERWFANDHKYFFRQIRLEKRPNPPQSRDASWRAFYRTTFELNNCMPRGAIAHRLNDFGAGILMSATLEPLNVYTEVTGVDYLSEIKNRNIITRHYPNTFPKENRLSVAVDLPKFTGTNRDDPENSTGDAAQLRRQYSSAIEKAVSRIPGNVLIAMPSYKEALWAGKVITQSQHTDKPVLVDQSSSTSETNRLREKFERGEGKVLTTSLRGTLTEGVDYDGDKLSGCIVVGVPIANVNSPTTEAVLTAYSERFGDNLGFQYAMTVPAIRKARQALGRVIRGTDEVGVRVLLDQRYCGGQGTVRHYLSEQEQEEYEPLESVDEMINAIENFYRDHGRSNGNWTQNLSQQSNRGA